MRRIRQALGVKAHVVEQPRIVALLGGAQLAQVARGYDLVGVDVRHVERRGDGGESGERLHLTLPASVFERR